MVERTTVALPASQTESTSDASSSYQSATLLTSSGHSIGTDSNHGIALITAFSYRQQCAVVPFIPHTLPEVTTTQL